MVPPRADGLGILAELVKEVKKRNITEIYIPQNGVCKTPD